MVGLACGFTHTPLVCLGIFETVIDLAANYNSVLRKLEQQIRIRFTGVRQYYRKIRHYKELHRALHTPIPE